MRVIGGSLGGRRLRAPRGAATRPTSDRVREAVFNILGEPPPSAAVLDLCAGAGGLGIEALSRGAERAVFVDQAQAAVRALRENLQTLGLTGASVVQRAEVRSAVRGLTGAFDWIFIDPPYATELASELLDLLGSGRVLSDRAVVVVEHDRRRSPAPAHGCLVRTDQRRYGDTVVSFYRPAPTSTRPEA